MKRFKEKFYRIIFKFLVIKMKALASAFSFYFNLNYKEVSFILQNSNDDESLIKNISFTFNIDEMKVRNFYSQLLNLNFTVVLNGKEISAKNVVSLIHHGTTIEIQKLEDGYALRNFLEQHLEVKVLPMYQYKDKLQMTFNLLKKK